VTASLYIYFRFSLKTNFNEKKPNPINNGRLLYDLILIRFRPIDISVVACRYTFWTCIICSVQIYAWMAKPSSVTCTGWPKKVKATINNHH